MRKILNILGIIIIVVVAVIFTNTFLYGLPLNVNKNITKTQNVEEEPELKMNELNLINDNNCKDFDNNLSYYKNELDENFLNSQEVSSYYYYDINTNNAYSYFENVEIATIFY